MIVLGDQKTGKQMLIRSLSGCNQSGETVAVTDCVAKLSLDIPIVNVDEKVVEKVSVRVFK